MSIVSFASDLLNHIPALPINLGTLIPVCVGFGLGQVATVFRELGAKQKEKKNIRLMLQLEIDHNLEQFELCRMTVKLLLKPDFSSDEVASTICEKLAVTFHGKAFDNFHPKFAEVLTPTEIRSIYSFYTLLEILSVRTAKLQENGDWNSETFRELRAIQADLLMIDTFAYDLKLTHYELPKVMWGDPENLKVKAKPKYRVWQ